MRYSLFLFLLLGALLAGRAAAPAAERTAAGVAVRSLRCEYAVDPLGIDEPHPRLSWTMEAKERGQAQTAYQVLVAGSEEALREDRGELWDSGRIASDESAHIAYAGKGLRSRQRCYWKVRVWDGH